MQAVRRQREACAKASEGQAPRDLRGRGKENEDAADHEQVFCRIIIIITTTTITNLQLELQQTFLTAHVAFDLPKA